MKEAKTILQQHKLSFFLPLGLALGLVAQWLFIGRPLGISWLLFVLILLGALLFSGRRAGLRPARRNYWLWPPLIFFATMVVLRANPFLTFLNIIATLCLLASVFYFYAVGSALQLQLTGILILPWRMLGLALANAGAVLSSGYEDKASQHVRRQQFMPVLRGGALALPIIIVFSTLLATADLVFKDYALRVIGLDLNTFMPYVGRGLFVLLIATLAAGAAATAVIRGLRHQKDDDSWIEQIIRRVPLHFSLTTVETSTIILLVSGLFLAFLHLQFRYLFGGETNINHAGFTYAEYARRGFFELILVASLSLALIILLNWLTRRETKCQLKSFNALSSILLSLVLLILVAAFWRMRLYQQAYGYTELRLIVLIFEIWLGFLLVWFLLTLWRAPEHFAPGFMIVLIGFVATLNLINPDVLIIRHNLQRYRQTGDLDLVYLTGLSADAVPELIRANSQMKDNNQLVDLPYCYENDCQKTMAELLGENLHARYDAMLENQNWLAAPSYHHARYRAARSLACFYNPVATATYLGAMKGSCPDLNN